MDFSRVYQNVAVFMEKEPTDGRANRGRRGRRGHRGRRGRRGRRNIIIK